MGAFVKESDIAVLRDHCTAFKIYKQMYMTAQHCLINDDMILHSQTSFVEPIYFLMDPFSPDNDYVLIVTKQDIEDWWSYKLADTGDKLPEYVFVNGFKGAEDLYISYQRVIYENDYIFATEGALFQGMSGSPAINEKREVVGILTMVSVPDNLSFYVKINNARVSDLIERNLKTMR